MQRRRVTGSQRLQQRQQQPCGRWRSRRSQGSVSRSSSSSSGRVGDGKAGGARGQSVAAAAAAEVEEPPPKATHLQLPLRRPHAVALLPQLPKARHDAALLPVSRRAAAAVGYCCCWGRVFAAALVCGALVVVCVCEAVAGGGVLLALRRARHTRLLRRPAAAAAAAGWREVRTNSTPAQPGVKLLKSNQRCRNTQSLAAASAVSCSRHSLQTAHKEAKTAQRN